MLKITFATLKSYHSQQLVTYYRNSRVKNWTTLKGSIIYKLYIDNRSRCEVQVVYVGHLNATRSREQIRQIKMFARYFQQ